MQITTNTHGRTKPPQPAAPGEWSLAQVIGALDRPLPATALKTKTLKGKRIDYIPWHTCCRILDKYAPGWSWSVTQMHTTHDRLFLVGRLTIPTTDGPISREATGTELLKRENDEGDIVELAYGDPSSNAESMALRRAAAKFGLARYLYA